ncbi:MAG: co-chaperone GroES [Bacteriovoracaceae bacterium]|nr:co-chaperone GroES [Bacteriovoracaceae bacterium]
MKIRPLQDKIVVKRIEEESKTASGIIIPDAHAEKPMQGEVISVGPGYRNQDGSITALDVSEGNRILFAKYAGQEIKFEGEEFLMMKESDILGVIE